MESCMYRLLTLVLLFGVLLCQGNDKNEEKLKQIKKMNNAQKSWKAAPNDLTNKTIEQLKVYCGVPNTDRKPVKGSKNYHAPKASSDIPKSFDAREQWPDCTTISSIKDQSNCMSCWAVSTAAAFSDRLCIATTATVNQNMSAEHLLSCCSECTDNEKGCQSGGWPDLAWKYIVETGIPTGGDYDSGDGCQPYEIPPCPGCSDTHETPPCHEDSCTNSDINEGYDKTVRYGKYYYYLSGIEQAQTDIMSHGSITTCFDVYEDFSSYETGVYYHIWGKKVGSHAVRVIGWGYDDNSEYNYWLVANSYSRTWGDNGYFKMRMGYNDCNFEQQFYAGIPKDSS